MGVRSEAAPVGPAGPASLPAEALSGRLVMLRLSLRNLTNSSLALVGEPMFQPTAQVRGSRILNELGGDCARGPAGRLRGCRVLEPGEELGVLVALWQEEGWRPTQDSVPVGELRVKWRGGGGEPATWASPTVLVMAKHLLRPTMPSEAGAEVGCSVTVTAERDGGAAPLAVGDRVRVQLALSAPAGALPPDQLLNLAPSAEWQAGAALSPAGDALSPDATAAVRSGADGSLSADVCISAVCSRPGSWALVPAKALDARVGGGQAIVLRGKPAHVLVLG